MSGMLAAIIIITLCVVSVSAVYIMQVYQPTQVTPAPSSQPRVGYVSMVVNSLDPDSKSALTTTTPVGIVYHLANAGAFPIVSASDLVSPAVLTFTAGASAAVTLGIGTGDNVAVGGGYKQYLVVYLYPGTAHYLYLPKMISGNAGIVTNMQTNVDLTADGYPDALFLIDLTGQSLSATQALATPVRVVEWVALLDNTISNNAPADINVPGAGAQSGTATLNEQLSFTTDALYKCFDIGRIYYTLNDTEAFLAPKGLTVTAFDGTQTVVSSPVLETVGSTTYVYYYPPAGQNYRFTFNGIILYRGAGSNSYTNVAWSFGYSFANNGASGYTTTVIFHYDIIGSTSNGGTITSGTDTVLIGNPS